jgi:O-acetyl-ADP-ribose deacetylase (regulator of RNase III)
MTRAYLLPAKKIVHTVGPRYNERYKTAAESALHYC